MFGSRVRVDGVAKVAELEAAEKLKMKEKVYIYTSPTLDTICLLCMHGTFKF